MAEAKKFHLHWPIFIASFAIGMLYVYLSNPPPKVILKFPSPYNAGKVIYHDKSDECFVFDSEKVTCPSDTSVIKKQPIQA